MNSKILLVIFAFVLLIPMPTSAASDLEVEFEATPLFSEANFAPGNTVTRFVKVTNGKNKEEAVAAEAKNVTDEDDLASQIDLAVTQGVTTYFSGTLKEFFTKKELSLGSIAGKSDLTFNFAATFKESAGNQYQGKTLGFDLMVGFLDQKKGGNGGGGGGSGLYISEKTVLHTPKNITSVIINWTTSYYSTSQVVYSKASEPHKFDINAPNYGYAHATVEDTTLVIDHRVGITDLKPKTTYFYRVVSHASPPSISLEYSFDMPEESILLPEHGTVAGTENPPATGSNSGIGKSKNQKNTIVASPSFKQTGKISGTEIAQDLTQEYLNEPKAADANYLYWWIAIIAGAILLAAGLVKLIRARS